MQEAKSSINRKNYNERNLKVDSNVIVIIKGDF